MSEYPEFSCETDSQYIQELIRYFSPEKVMKIVEHERQHFIASKILGYSPYYRAKILTIEGTVIDFVGFIDFKEGIKNIKKRDLLKIALAPLIPSEEDYSLAKKMVEEEVA